MTLIREIIPDNAVYALGWAFLNSLWQGIPVLLGYKMIQAVAGGKAYRLRYRAAQAGSLLLLLAFVLTFLLNLREKAVEAGTYLSGPHAVAFLSDPLNAGKHEARNLVAGFFSRYTGILIPWISLCWFMGASFMFFRVTGGYICLKMIRGDSSSMEEAGWRSWIGQKRKLLGIRRAVKLVVSARTRVPVVIGHLRPMILVPAGLLFSIPPAQVEAILLHELAHIRHNDFLSNLLLILSEIFLFYHPVNWYLTACARQESEYLADELVVQHQGDRAGLANALVCLQEIQSRNAFPVPAFSGRPSFFFHRIMRILNTQTMKTKTNSNWTIGILVAGIALFSLAAGTTDQIHFRDGSLPILGVSLGKTGYEAVQDPARQAAKSTEEILIPNEATGVTEKVVVEQKGDKIASVTVDGKKQKGTSRSEYERKIQEYREKERDNSMPPVRSHVTVLEAGIRLPHISLPEIPDIPWEAPFPHAGLEDLMSHLEMIPPVLPEWELMPNHVTIPHVSPQEPDSAEWARMREHFRQSSAEYRKAMEEMKQELQRNREQYLQMSEKIRQEYAARLEEARSEMERYRSAREEELQKEWQEHAADRKRILEEELRHRSRENEMIRQQMETEFRKSMQERMEEMKKLQMQHQQEMRIHEEHVRQEIAQAREKTGKLKEILARELVKDGVIQEAEDFDLRLDRTRLVVNGKKQPEKLHQKYLELYSRQTGNKLTDDTSIEIHNR